MNEDDIDLDELKTLVASAPDNLELLLDMAKAYEADGQWHNAINAHKQALSLEESENADLYCQLGTLYEEIDDSDLAEQSYLKALESEPEHTESLLNLGYLYREQEKFAEAITILQRCARLTNLGSDAHGEAIGLIGEILREHGGELPSFDRWVQVAETIGTTQTGMVVEFLREEGIHAVALGSRALGIITGENTVARVMVPEEEVGPTLDLLDPQSDSEDRWVGTADSDSTSSMSSTTKALLGATAFVFSPLGAGIAIAMSQTFNSEEDKDTNNLIDCPNCWTGLELSDDEMEQRQFTCPECNQITRLDDMVVCPSCRLSLKLDADEQSRGWYICPECRWAVRLAQS
jgi:uncharacterized protein YbaR (Trm112 family)